MRALTQEDLIAAARAVQCCPAPARAAFMARMLYEAHAADRYRKRLRRVHPRWGDGTLIARALRELRAPVGPLGPGYVEALACVLLGLRIWRSRR